MTTFLLRASRVLALPGQQMNLKDRLSQVWKSLVGFLKPATLPREGTRLDLNSQEKHRSKNLSFAADVVLVQHRQNISLR